VGDWTRRKIKSREVDLKPTYKHRSLKLCVGQKSLMGINEEWREQREERIHAQPLNELLKKQAEKWKE